MHSSMRKRANTASKPPLSPSPTVPQLNANKIGAYPLSKNALGGSVASLPDGTLAKKKIDEFNLLSYNERTLSASNLHALSLGNLSLKLATPTRLYNDPRSQGAAAKAQFELKVRAYNYQLTVGCGNPKCRNKFCLSCPDGATLQPDLAAIMSIQLASRTKTFFCAGTTPPLESPYISESAFMTPQPVAGQPPPSQPFLHAVFTASPFRSLYGPQFTSTPQPRRPQRIASPQSLRWFGGAMKTAGTVGGRAKGESRLQYEVEEAELERDTSFERSGIGHGGVVSQAELDEVEAGFNSVHEDSEMGRQDDKVVEGLSLTYLTKELLAQAIDTYHTTQDDSFLLNTIRTVFSSSEALNMSFKAGPDTPSVPHSSNLDLASVKESYAMILSLEPQDTFEHSLASALELLIAHLANTSVPASDLSQLLVILEFPPLVNKPTYLESMVRGLARIISELPESSAQLLRYWLSRYDKDDFGNKVQLLQNYVSVHHYSSQRPDLHMVHALNALQLLYEANELAGRDLEVRAVEPSLFYNAHPYRKVDFKDEYHLWKKLHRDREGPGRKVRVSLFDYPFLFDPAAKSRILHIDAIVQMSKVFEEAFVRSAWVFQAQKILEDSSRSVAMEGELRSAMCPYLVLEIRRDHLMEDTLAQLTSKNTPDLKKPLKIKYVGGGEEGLDMGGVQKEFFQFIVEQIFNPEVGMFVYNEETRLCWPNAFSMETQREFELVGLLLGLAIYNGVILDIRFPSVMYKKLLGQSLSLADLKTVEPRLAKSLRELRDWTDDKGDVEDVFCYTFQVATSLFGEVHTVDLKPNGGNIPVTNSNKDEFVAAYVDYVLHSSIRTQFRAFSRGFHRVCGGEALYLCTPAELELLICGSPDFDFEALESAATYDDGYSATHPLIIEFWKTVHGMDQAQKIKLLNFVTGSGRVPIGGLANMAFVVQRNGPDSHRLPTALTCFGRLLLPEYSSGRKLKEKLMLALENGQGFGLV